MGRRKTYGRLFSYYIDRVRGTWGIDVGYRAIVQDYIPGRGYVREQYEYYPDASTVYVYAGDADVFIDPSYEEHIINYAKYSLEKYLGPLYDIISRYIVGVEVIKGFSDGLFNRYAVEFELDSNVFRRGRSVVVYVHVYRREDIIFSHGIRISLDLGNIGFVDEFINYLVNEMRGIKESLEQRGLTVNMKFYLAIMYRSIITI